ncbi:sulfotransferase 2B1 [Bombina bombina]|uniref:sulfotransferase 2B1 n=1 Tax=Bombina bombina TaxID=8345 RepID=UPI00235AFE97|nr:sulfotransferase 2B1 [Bombina bombina]XP_053546630.1 sulfotransferase 2B1 [Bombina bombina]
MDTDYFQHKDINFASIVYSAERLNFLENEFQVRDDDVFIVTFPKSGTNWMMEILSLIRSNGDPTWCHDLPIWERIPWLEARDSKILIDSMSSPRFFSSHLPIQFFPKSFFTSKAKVIYTARNPKDVLVSLYHFAQMAYVIKTPCSLDEFVEDFLQGRVPFGSWFDHIKGWLQMKDNSNFLFISYEELKQDHKATVLKICNFLGKVLDNEAIDMVVEHSSFNSMKQNKMSNQSEAPDFIMNKKYNFMRKGIRGDWRNHFTDSQQEYIDRIYQEKMKGLSLHFIWDES